MKCTVYNYALTKNTKVYKYVDQLEMVQHRAARFVKSVPHRCTKPLTSVSAIVSDLGWEPLQTSALLHVFGRRVQMYNLLTFLQSSGSGSVSGTILQRMSRHTVVSEQR